jgi:hypothetical protein
MIAPTGRWLEWGRPYRVSAAVAGGIHVDIRRDHNMGLGSIGRAVSLNQPLMGQMLLFRGHYFRKNRSEPQQSKPFGHAQTPLVVRQHFKPTALVAGGPCRFGWRGIMGMPPIARTSAASDVAFLRAAAAHMASYRRNTG